MLRIVIAVSGISIARFIYRSLKENDHLSMNAVIVSNVATNNPAVAIDIFVIIS